MKTVHMIGIGGTGMVALAGLFTEKGWKVRGSDRNVYPPASTELARMNVEIREGFQVENLSPRPDLVVVGNVVTRSNPEATALLESGLPYTSMAQALTEHFLPGRRSVVVTGTHGKTTTTSLTAWILYHAGLDPGLFVGGIPTNFGQGYRLGTGAPFVIEGDEYDTAFFEKTPKFLHYRPEEVILTGIEFDHADIYRDLRHVVEQFERLMALLPKDGHLFINGDSELVRKVSALRVGGTTETYGIGAEADWSARAVQPTPTGMSFEVWYRNAKSATVLSTMLGTHNICNTLTAIALANTFGVPPEKSAEAVATFQGVRRRQQFLGEEQGVRVYDDFAHHPSAIKATLDGFRPVTEARKGRLWAIFEPRSNTIRRRTFEKILPESFASADEVILGPVFEKADSLAAEDRLRPEWVAETISAGEGRGRAAGSREEILEALLSEVRPNDLVVFMSNGDFGGIPGKLLQRLTKS